MASPKEADVAEALVDDLNSATWTLPVIAAWHWLTEFGIEDLETRRVIVSPMSDEDAIDEKTDNDKRAHGEFDFPMSLTYQAKVDSTDRDAINAEARQVQDIHDRYYFNRKELTAVTGHNSKAAWVAGCQRTQVYDFEKLRQHGIFESVIKITVRLWRT